MASKQHLATNTSRKQTVKKRHNSKILNQQIWNDEGLN